MDESIVSVLKTQITGQHRNTVIHDSSASNSELQSLRTVNEQLRKELSENKNLECYTCNNNKKTSERSQESHKITDEQTE